MKNAIKELWFCIFPPLDLRIKVVEEKIRDIQYQIEDSNDMEWDLRAECGNLCRKLDKLKNKKK